MKRFVGVIMFAVCMLFLGGRAMAAGTAEVAVKGEAFSKGTKEWSVSCELSGSTAVTNGKLRVTYDGSKLKLVSSAAGDLLNGAMPEINDPVSGNKSEGEVVLVFASANQINGSGTLLNLNFQVQDTVQDGDEITVSVKTEELINGGESVETKDLPLSFNVGGSIKDPVDTGSSQDTNNSTGQTDDTKDTTATEPNGGQTGNPSGTGGGQTGSTSGQTGSATGNPAGGQNSGTVASAKTGDSTNAALPAAGALAALAVAGFVIWRKKAVK